MTFRHLASIGLVLSAIPSAGAAEQRVLPSVPAYILTSPAGTSDALFEVLPTANGFIASYARNKTGEAAFTLYTQRFSASGRPVGPAVQIDGPGLVGDHVEMARTGTSTAVAAWMAQGQVKIGKLDLGTGKVSGAKLIGKSDDHIHDIARLSNGNIAVVTPQVNPLPLPGKYRVMLKLLSPQLATVKDWASVNGAGFPLDAWAYLDQTVVARKTGGTVLYRDHVTQKIMGRNFANSGALGTTVTLNTTPFKSFFVQDIAYLEVKAATLTNGSVAACWTASTEASSRYTVRCRLLDAGGKPIGKEFRPSTATGAQTAPDVIALPKGKFTVTWAQTGIIFPTGVNYRTYDQTGKALTPEREGGKLPGLNLAPLQTEGALLADGSIVSLVSPEFNKPGIMAFGIRKPAP